MAIPTKDSLCVPWMQNFSTRLTASPATWGQTALIATAVAAAVDAYVQAYEALEQARADGTRSKASTAAKDSARLAALELIRPIYMGVQASYSISDENKILLGVKVPDRTRTPEPSPTTQVILTQVRMVNRTATFSLRDSGSESSRARPFGARGASVFYCVGAEPQPPGDGWFFAGNATRPTVDVVLSKAPVEACTVWVCAMWYGSRGELGPVSPVVRLDLPSIQYTPVSMKLAA